VKNKPKLHESEKDVSEKIFESENKLKHVCPCVHPMLGYQETKITWKRMGKKNAQPQDTDGDSGKKRKSTGARQQYL